MKLLIRIYILAFLLIIISFSFAEGIDNNLLTIAKGNNIFGLDLYQILTAKEDGNIFYLPL